MARNFYAEKAEQEANKIGMEFAHSNDVARDMSRAYHVDFSNIKVHTDAAADSRVKAAGKDALAQGNDLFFGKGIYESSEPDAKALVAHEFAHTMQQGAADGAGAVQESAPMGAEQGGLRDWFRKRTGKKKKPQMENPYNEDGEFVGYRIQGAKGNDAKRDFMSTQSRALYQMAKNATPDQLQDPLFRKLIMDYYKQNMAARLQGYENMDYTQMFSAVFRKDNAGEMETFNKMMEANVSNNLVDELLDIYKQNRTADPEGMTPQQARGERMRNLKPEDSDAMISHVEDHLAENSDLMEILEAGLEGFGNSKHFTGENAGNASNMMMNTLILRGVAPKLAKRVGSTEEVSHELEAAMILQKGVRLGEGTSEKSKSFLGLLNGLMMGRRAGHKNKWLKNRGR